MQHSRMQKKKRRVKEPKAASGQPHRTARILPALSLTMERIPQRQLALIGSITMDTPCARRACARARGRRSPTTLH